MSVNVINLSVYTQPSITESTRDNWVEYGEKNDYYNWLIDRYRNSATNNAIINNMARLIYGKGLSAKDASRKPNEYAQMLSLFKKNAIRNVALELKMLGAGCFQVMKNSKGEVTGVEHLPIHLLRPEKCDKDGKINNWYYSDNWDEIRKFPPRPIPVFGTSKAQIEVLVFGRYSVGRKYFYSVDYEGALDYCVLEEEIAAYLINETKNSFSPTMIVNFNNGTSDPEEMKKTVRNVEGKLTGGTGKKILCSFNDNETLKTTVDAIPLNDAPRHYEYLSNEARGKILAGHNVISSFLVGIQPDGQGFSSSADEIATAGNYFHNKVIVPFQELIIDAIDQILAVNGISLDLYFKKLDPLEDNQPKAPVTMSAHVSLESVLDKFGEDEDLNEWELIDEREVDYDNEEDFDKQLEEHFTKKPSLLQRVVNFVSTGVASPNQKSSQDKEVNGFFFKVRYQYTGNPTPERDFCKAMMSRNKLYRKEDIKLMSGLIVNPGLGEFGTDTYDIFLYKGGARCSHKWLRKTYVSASKNLDVNNPNAPTISTTKAEKFGYVVRNPKEVAMMPKDMPLKGFSPNNKNLPSDVA